MTKQTATFCTMSTGNQSEKDIFATGKQFLRSREAFGSNTIVE